MDKSNSVSPSGSPSERRFYGKGQHEPGGYEYEKQKKENKEANDFVNKYMKRKPLSMKALHQYAIDYLKFYSEDDEENILDAEEKMQTIQDFFDYIWKNPK
jgi:hypothetical protein